MNYIHVEETCCEIVIGIKEGKVVKVDWEDLLHCTCCGPKNLLDKNVQKFVKKYLKNALTMLEKK